MATGSSGYQPRNTPAERRAFFDSQRCCEELKARVAALEAAAAAPAPPPLEMIAATEDAVGALRNEVYYTRRFRAHWQYSNTTTTPPGAGQIRSDVPLTRLFIHKNDTDGYDRSIQLDFVPHGALIRVRGTTGNVFELRVTGESIDHGVWYELPVSVISGSAADKGFRVELTMFTGIWAEDEPPVIWGGPFE